MVAETIRVCFSELSTRLLVQQSRTISSTPSKNEKGQLTLKEAKERQILKTRFDVPDNSDILLSELPDTSNATNERDFDRIMTPLLSTLVPDGLVLVNSEDFSWVVTLGGERNNYQKPDFFVCHPAMVESRKKKVTPSFTPLPGAHYGVLSDFRLRDGLGGILDCKLTVTNEAFGELIIHLEHLCRGHEGMLRGVLFGKADQPIYFVKMARGVVAEIIQTTWAAPGLKTFWKRFLTPSSPWALALSQLCLQLQLDCVIPSDANQLLFLGKGTFGRVFKVSQRGVEFALKVLGSETGRREYGTLQRIKAKGGNVVTVSHWTDVGNGMAGYLMAEVGSKPCTHKEADRRAIFNALLRLHLLDFVHGDCRLANIISFRGELLWIDFMESMATCWFQRQMDLQKLLLSVYRFDIDWQTLVYGAEGQGNEWEAQMNEAVCQGERYLAANPQSDSSSSMMFVNRSFCSILSTLVSIRYGTKATSNAQADCEHEVQDDADEE